ncbi:hypothetical protein [Occallatibacter riparius]|uniref:Uncharacterized protein n=1 Tax=Occallatibacter riparius TaxID=1002689 RepID=A0A9J7BLF2_9BACT|nr:hypothetical protein [Occallatibacter riparius]UWZ83475.1 hypothetical protein MOP44_23280 [Occallatibacter riparius]
MPPSDPKEQVETLTAAVAAIPVAAAVDAPSKLVFDEVAVLCSDVFTAKIAPPIDGTVRTPLRAHWDRLLAVRAHLIFHAQQTSFSSLHGQAEAIQRSF